jgi:hypothetical protein
MASSFFLQLWIQLSVETFPAGMKVIALGSGTQALDKKIAWLMSCHDVPRNHDKGSRTWFLPILEVGPKSCDFGDNWLKL